MATVTTTRVVCDLHAKDGEEVDAEKRIITIGRRRFTPDLCDACHEALLGPVVEALTAARGSNGAPPAPASRGRKKKGPKPSVVRQWAKEHGVEVGDTGRVPQEVVERYLAAQ